MCSSRQSVTLNKLHEMKLGVMADSFQKQVADNAMSELSFEERFGLIVDAEWLSRQNNRLTRLIKNAGFAFPNASLEDIEYRADRKLDKAQITRLGTCNYIEECHNIIILGATGSGKSYISNAFGMKAVRNFFYTIYQVA